MELSGLSTVWRLASWPTRRSPVLVNATTEGGKRLPSLLIITVGFPPSITATTELVVPRSMPTAFAISHLAMCIIRTAHIDNVLCDPLKASPALHVEQVLYQSYMALISHGFLALIPM